MSRFVGSVLKDSEGTEIKVKAYRTGTGTYATNKGSRTLTQLKEMQVISEGPTLHISLNKQEDDMSAPTKGKKKRTATKKAARPNTNEFGIREGSVTMSVFNALRKGGTFEQIHKAVCKDHKDRKPDQLAETVRCQISRIPKRSPKLSATRSEKGVYKLVVKKK